MKVKVRAIDKGKFDISIVNPNDDIELANLLNPVVREFKNKNKLCQSNRGFCFIHSEDFLNWVDREYPILYRKLLERGISVMEGLFQIDDPEKLPLNEADLYSEEFGKFLEEEEYNYSGLKGDRRELSNLIWEWSKKNIEKLDDFYYINHSWVDVDGLIIDFTWLQFRHAINNKVPLKERYEY